MHNTQKPNLDELPSSTQLLRSTFIAAAAAIAILVTTVLPSEYGIDPTGIGRVLGLTEMGDIKTQLSKEAEADRQMVEETLGDQSSLGNMILGIFIGSAHAQETPPARTDQLSVTLTPGQGIEVKLTMEKGAIAPFSWTVEGGVANYDLHGDGNGRSISYEKGRAVSGHQGELIADFTGNHGWFWRNRDDQPIIITLNIAGAYSKITRYD